MRDSCCGGGRSHDEVDAVEGAVSEDSVVAAGRGVEDAVEAGDVLPEDVDGQTGILECGESVDVVVFVAEARAQALDIEGGEAGEVGSGSTGSDYAVEAAPEHDEIGAVIGVAGEDGSDRAASHVKGEVGHGAVICVAGIGEVLEERFGEEDAVAAA